MKTKVIFGVLILAVLCIGFILFWPLSFTDSGSNEDHIQVIYTDLRTENGVSKNTATSYSFIPGSIGYTQMQQILSKYSFHRSFGTFFHSNVSVDDGNVPGYWIQIYLAKKTIMCGRASDIVVNGKIYRIGYWGNGVALTMMDEIQNVLDSSIPDKIN